MPRAQFHRVRQFFEVAQTEMLQEKLPATAFIQPHKSYVVAIDKIASLEGNMLHIAQYTVPISKYQKEEVMEKIVNSKLLKR